MDDVCKVCGEVHGEDGWDDEDWDYAIEKLQLLLGGDPWSSLSL